MTAQGSDIITEMHSKDIQPFIAVLESEFYSDDEMIAESIQRNSSFNIIHRESMFKVDVFIPQRGYLQPNCFYCMIG